MWRVRGSQYRQRKTSISGRDKHLHIGEVGDHDRPLLLTTSSLRAISFPESPWNTAWNLPEAHEIAQIGCCQNSAKSQTLWKKKMILQTIMCISHIWRDCENSFLGSIPKAPTEETGVAHDPTPFVSPCVMPSMAACPRTIERFFILDAQGHTIIGRFISTRRGCPFLRGGSPTPLFGSKCFTCWWN